MAKDASSKPEHGGRVPTIRECEEFNRAFNKWYKKRFGGTYGYNKHKNTNPRKSGKESSP